MQLKGKALYNNINTIALAPLTFLGLCGLKKTSHLSIVPPLDVIGRLGVVEYHASKIERRTQVNVQIVASEDLRDGLCPIK